MKTIIIICFETRYFTLCKFYDKLCFYFFQLNVGDVGSIYKVRVTNALRRAWCMRDVTLVDVHTKDKLVFNFSRFVGENNGEITHTLLSSNY